jgi:hypothetical protein
MPVPSSWRCGSVEVVLLDVGPLVVDRREVRRAQLVVVRGRLVDVAEVAVEINVTWPSGLSDRSWMIRGLPP